MRVTCRAFEDGQTDKQMKAARRAGTFEIAEIAISKIVMMT